jgi:hypothetical protein
MDLLICPFIIAYAACSLLIVSPLPELILQGERIILIILGLNFNINFIYFLVFKIC